MPKHSMFKHPSMNTTMADRLTMIVADITAAETVSDTPGGYDKIREEHTCGILLAYCVSTAAVIQKKRGRAHLDEIQGRQRLASFPRNGAEDGHRRSECEFGRQHVGIRAVQIGKELSDK